MKKVLYSILLFFIIFVLSGCNKKLEIIGEEEVVINESVYYTLNTGEDNAIWSSSDDNIATVDNGVVTGINIGTVTIKAKVGSKSATKKIKIIYPTINITIESKSTLIVGEKYRYFANIPEIYQDLDEGKWSSGNENIITIDDRGVANPISSGTTVIIYEYYGNTLYTDVNVIYKEAKGVSLNGANNVAVNSLLQLETIFYPENSKSDCYYSSSDETIATVDENGVVKGITPGKVEITVYLKDNPSVSSSKTIEVFINPSKIDFSISGLSNYKIELRDVYPIKLEIDGINYDEKFHKNLFIIEIENPEILYMDETSLIGFKVGSTKVTIKSKLNSAVIASHNIEVLAGEDKFDGFTETDYKKADEILSQMTLSQKVGQMFVVGFNGTTFNSTLKNAISNYNFGNVIYMGANVTNPDTLPQLSKDIQEYMISKNLVPAFISTDQEGGRVARLKNGATHFVSNMAIAATNNHNYASKQGEAMAKELLYYGINMDLAPVLDVNNNHDNPVIGVRSYSDDPVTVAKYGTALIKSLQDNGVIACPKHFPGHGNTNVDSHYGLPVIDSGLNSLYNVEFVPFIHAINNGLDCIMTTHIIFNAIDNKYPATLSEKVLTGFLRNELGYNGLIATDGMEMNAVAKYFGDYDETAVLAVKAGVDLLLYTTTSNPIKAYNGLMKAIANGEISEERINESVRRILLTKIKYGILDQSADIIDDLSSLLNTNKNLSIEIACNSLTVAKGEFNSLSKDKNTLIIAPSNIDLLDYTKAYLLENGFVSCDVYSITTNVTSNELNNIEKILKNYDQIVYANSNVSTNYSNTIELVNLIISENKESIIIALDSPYDYLKYNNKNIETYICLYGYQEVTKIALAKLLNNEYKPTGELPIDKSLFE